jgi:3-isopropylmalate/(R)-2-methylmalate dehydratase small subunit
MRAFTHWQGTAVPVDRANVDTDAILPKQYMKVLSRSGLGPHLFDEWRYLDTGEPGQDCARRPRNPACPLNDPRHAGASILLARENFGCGSSREHAPWAIDDAGIRVLVAPSFADIFRGNCLQNGLLTVTLPTAAIDALFTQVHRAPRSPWSVDLPTPRLAVEGGPAFAFDIEPFAKQRLIEGLDEVARTLQQRALIEAYEARRREAEPWVFDGWLTA